MANEVTTQQQPAGVLAAVESRMEAISSALPKSVPSTKFLQLFKQAIMRDPKLLRCTERSVVEAVSKAAADGLVLDGREAALVVYEENKKINGNWVKTPVAQYLPMYIGMMKRARNSGHIASMTAGIVYEAEIQEGLFEFEAGSGGFIRHKPKLVGDRGKPVAAYSVARMRDGTFDVVVLREDEILHRKSRARGVDGAKSPWNTDPMEMWKKTVIRQHCKTLPMDSDLARLFERFDDHFDLNQLPPSTKSPRVSGAARLAALEAPEETEVHQGEELEGTVEPQSSPRAASKGKAARQVAPKADEAAPEAPEANERDEEGPDDDEAGF